MPEIAGLIKCPVCGAEGQELRINKNRKLYVYCDHGCALRFNSAQSRHWLAELAAGRPIIEQNLRILPLKTTISTHQHIEKTQQKGAIENDGRRNTVNGRPDGQSAAVAGVQSTGTGGRGWLANWLDDDDE